MKNRRGKIIASIFALSIVVILTAISLISFVSSVEAVTVTNPDLDAASLSLSLFKKPSPTGHVVDDSGNTIATVTIKADEEVGRVRDDFYGVSNYKKFFSENGVYMPSVKKYTNYTWNRQMFLESGMTITRQRAYMNYLFSNNTESFDIKVNDTEQLRQIAEEVKWQNENGNSVIISIVNMPEYLQNRTSGYCNESFWASCPPNNYTAYADMVVYFLNNITNYGEYNNVILEVGNEPYGGDKFSSTYSFGWCNNLSYDNIIKAEEYVKIFNSTYSALKEIPKLSYINVIGPSGYIWNNNIMNIFLSNISIKMDGASIHPYGYNEINRLEQYKDTKNLINLCKIYDANCSSIYLSEWDVGTIWLKNDTSKKDILYNSYAQSYISILNNYPSNVSMILWDWSETVPYSGKDQYWEMVIQPELASIDYEQFKPKYNVTKDFAHYHAAGNMIVNSSSNNNSIKSVTSLNPQGIWHITVINAGKGNINVNIDVSSTGVEAIKDLATGTIYIVSNGIANVGILTEYDVKHYEGVADYEPPVVEEKSSSGGSSSSTSNKAVSINELSLGTNEVVSIKPNTSTVISTSDILIDVQTNSDSGEEEIPYGPVKASEEDRRLYQEEYESELEGSAHIGSLSLAVSNKSYLTIMIILIGSIICTAIIISIIYRKKKREADKVKKLMDWVDKARELGYTPEKMKEMLVQYNWDKDLVDKAIGK